MTGCLRDTGANTCVITKSCVPAYKFEGARQVPCTMGDGRKVMAPEVLIDIDCPYYQGQAYAVCLEHPSHAFILGNIVGATYPTDPNCSSLENTVCAIKTRAITQKDQRPPPKLKVPTIEGLDITSEKLIMLQEEDVTLKTSIDSAKNGTVRNIMNNKVWFTRRKGVLTRHSSTNPPVIEGHEEEKKQVVVPSKLRENVLQLAHDSAFAGHLGFQKTLDRVESSFHWPGITGDVKRYCASCDRCQRIGIRPTRAPLGNHQLITEPFKKVSIDLIGPLIPASSEGHRSVLTCIDFATKYPMAIALKKTDSRTIADALLEMFQHTGLPVELLSDNGPNLVSDLMKEVCRLLSIKHLTTPVYDPKSNGLVEKLNSTVKRCIRKLTVDQPTQWHRFLSATMFALREVPSETTGFSPFELLYGRTPRGPMQILKHMWTKDPEEEPKTAYQYVLDLGDRLQKTSELAREASAKAKVKQKTYYDRKSKERFLDVGSKVLVLLPTKHNKLELTWKGPFEILEKKGGSTYVIKCDDKNKIFPINLLKQYVERNTRGDTDVHGPHSSSNILRVVNAITIDEEECHHATDPYPSSKILHSPTLSGGETYRDVIINPELSVNQKKEISDLLIKHTNTLTEVPGKTNLERHHITLTTNDVFRRKPYPCPHALRGVMRKEIDDLLKAGIIQPSKSPYCSPCLLVKKSDSTYRFCFDGRLVNSFTVFDAEPLPNMQYLVDEMHDAVFLTSCDMAKGYWQLEIDEESRKYTAFAAADTQNLYEFVRMPFGLVNSAASFSRLMRTVLKDMDGVKNYVDDIIVFSATWSEHIATLKELFIRLQSAGLTVKPSKCHVGFNTIKFLGHMIGNGQKRPLEDKVNAIMNASPPHTKKVMQSFLGLTGWYREFIPHYSSLTAPLSDAVRFGYPNAITWTVEMNESFVQLKKCMASEPILKLPDYTKEFMVQTDASGLAVSGALLQEHEGRRFPVLYLGRKLKGAELNYPVVEQECLALVYTLDKLKFYLTGKEFMLETDHAPLLYLNKYKNGNNKRLTRWALELQEYRFRVVAIKGSTNHLADFLSRCPVEEPVNQM